MHSIARISCLILLIAQPVLVPAQQKPTKPVTAPKPAPVLDPVLMNIEKSPVYLSEFRRVYAKNNKDSIYTEKAVREYLDLYVNYKLKVREAETLQMDTSAAFKSELAGYRKQLAQPYLTDKTVADQMVTEAYDRLKKDVRASHILLKVAEEALPKDTLVAYNRLMKMREKLVKGADFAKMARDSSEDPSAKENAGDLGYFTGMQMVYPFETVAYTTKPGQISMPVRTRFGYHLIRVTDIRDAQGEIHVAHIMIRLPKDGSDSSMKVAQAKILLAEEELKSGLPWDTAVSRYSEDKGSVKRGGEIPWFGTGRMVPEFEKAAFALQTDGAISAPIKSSYGWHIIKRLERKGIPSFDEKKGELKSMIQRDSRSDASKNAMVQKIKKEYSFRENVKNREAFINTLDSTLYLGTWDLNRAENFNAPLFTLTDSLPKAFTQQDFAKYISTHQTKRVTASPQVIGQAMYQSWVGDECLAFEESRLEKKYPDFNHLMNEYRDGILLFDLTDKMVWSKAVKDTAGLQAFYQTVNSRYLYDERYDAIVYECADEKTALSLRKALLKGTKSPETIMTSLNKKGNKVSSKDAIWMEGQNEAVDRMQSKAGIGEIQQIKDKYVITDLKKVLPPTPKELNLVKGAVQTEYQAYLEKEWIASLRAKYPVEVKEEVLRKMWSN